MTSANSDEVSRKFMFILEVDKGVLASVGHLRAIAGNTSQKTLFYS